MKKLKGLILMVVLMSILLTGCVFNEDIKANEVGVLLYRNAIDSIKLPGVVLDMRYWADLRVMSVNTLTFSVEDPEVMTKGNQAVALKITIQGRRLSDEASVRNIVTNWSTLMNDETLVDVVTATARESMKNSVREFTLTELFDDRNGLADSMTEQLRMDAGKYSFEIVNVTIENVAADPEYMAILADKAKIGVEVEKELERQNLINQKAQNDVLQAKKDAEVLKEQTLAQIAQTQYDLEIATREGKKIAAAQQVYSDNPQAFELERLKLYANIFGKGTVYFLESGQNLSLFLMGDGTQKLPVIPVTEGK